MVGCFGLACGKNYTKLEKFLKISNKIQNSNEQGIFDETGCLPPCDFFELSIKEKEPLFKGVFDPEEYDGNDTILEFNFYLPEGHFVEREQVQEILSWTLYIKI